MKDSLLAYGDWSVWNVLLSAPVILFIAGWVWWRYQRRTTGSMVNRWICSRRGHNWSYMSFAVKGGGHMGVNGPCERCGFESKEIEEGISRVMEHIDIGEKRCNVPDPPPNEPKPIGIPLDLALSSAQSSALEATTAIPKYAPNANIISASNLDHDWIRYYVPAFFANLLFVAAWDSHFSDDEMADLSQKCKRVLDTFDAKAFGNMRACLMMLHDNCGREALAQTPENPEVLISSCLGSFVWFRLATNFPENADLQRIARDDLMCWKLTGAMMRMDAEHLVDIAAAGAASLTPDNKCRHLVFGGEGADG